MGGYSMWFIYKSRHVNYGREQVVFRCKMENIIDTYRNRIKAMGYEPRRQEDIPDVMAAYCDAIANCKIEGLELVSDRSEEHKSELQSLMSISYAVLRLKKKNKNK